jgi:hypothetical protein
MNVKEKKGHNKFAGQPIGNAFSEIVVRSEPADQAGNSNRADNAQCRVSFRVKRTICSRKAAANAAILVN